MTRRKTIKKRAFVSAIAMLVISAIVLTTSTFAWFRMGKTVAVEAMKLSVDAPDGIQISANATEASWGRIVTTTDLFVATEGNKAAYSGNYNVLPEKLETVSCAFAGANSSNGFANFYKVSVDDADLSATSTLVDQTAIDPESTTKGVGFVAFDIFLRTAKDTEVYFAKNSKFEYDTADEAEKADTEGIKTALRVGYQILGNVAIDAPASEAVALKNFDASKCTVFELDSANRSADAKNNGIAAGVLTTNYITGTTVGAVDEASYVIPASGTGVAAEGASGATIYKSADAAEATISLSAGITKMRIYIWMEGQDVDCQNSVANSKDLVASLVFNIKES